MKDVNWTNWPVVGSWRAVWTRRVAYSRRSPHPHTFVDRQIVNGRVSIRGECRVVVAAR